MKRPFPPPAAGSTRVACSFFLVAAAAATALNGASGIRPATRAGQSPLEQSRQMLVVVTAGWESVSGTLGRFDRPNVSAAWRRVGGPVPVAVGRNGLAWGRGLQVETADGPVKKEGDGKAPAGVFRLVEVFGQTAAPPAGLAMPYRFLRDNVECVDDVHSAHYNTLVARQQVDRVDWTSSEKMWREPLYKWGVVVAHNSGVPQPAGGSCIFLHIWKGPAAGTAGCTAMPEAALVETIEWLNAEKGPVVVQLPRAEYERLKRAWQLP